MRFHHQRTCGWKVLVRDLGRGKDFVFFLLKWQFLSFQGCYQEVAYFLSTCSPLDPIPSPSQLQGRLGNRMSQVLS